MKIFCLIAIAGLTVSAQPLPASPVIADSTVVAKVEGKDLTAGDVRHMLEVAGPQFMQLFQRNPQNAIQQLYLNQYLAKEGERLKLAERSPLKEQLEFQRTWAIATAMVNQEQNGYQVPMADMDRYYKENQSRYSQAKVKVITISYRPQVEQKGTSPDDVKRMAEEAFNAAHGQRSEEDAVKRAAEVMQKLKAGGDFVKLMAEYSENDTAKTGEDFATIKSTGFPEEIRKAVFALKEPGDVTDPVKLPGFFYILRLESKSAQSIDEVRSAIIFELRSQHMNTWFSSLMKRYEPTILNTDFFIRPGAAVPPQPTKP
jgi:parvulin-like peptidyl-prolyl isomerase